MSDDNCQNNNEGDAILLFNYVDGLQKAEMGRDVAVRPARHKKRRGDGIEAFACNVGSLDMESQCVKNATLSLSPSQPVQSWERLRSARC